MARATKHERVELLNRHGAFQEINESPFAPVGHRVGDAERGVEHWTSALEASGAGGAPYLTAAQSWQAAGYVDPHGDGSATFRTMDIAGLDVLAHVMTNLEDRLPGEADRAWFRQPALVTRLLERGALGEKTGRGFYERRREAQRAVAVVHRLPVRRAAQAGALAGVRARDISQ